MSAQAPHAEMRRILPGPDQVALRALLVLGVVVALGSAEVAGARVETWVQTCVVLLAVATALRPESIAGVVALGGAAYAWALVPQPLSPLVLVVTAGMVLTHVTALVAAQGPAVARVDRTQAWLWLRRGVALWAAAAGVWGLAQLLDDHPGGRATYAVGLLLVVAVAVLGTRLVGRRVG